MKAVISNRIYLKGPTVILNHIKEQLTYKLETKIPIKGGKSRVTTEVIRNYKIASGDILSIPRGRTDLIPEGYEIVDKRATNEVPFPNPKFPLREAQQEVYDEVEGDCFINALVGWGKTFTALHIARKLGQKTLVITHNTMLRDQWIKEITTLFGHPPGIISAGIFDIEDHFIVVGNVQTLTKHSLAISKEFGTVIMDEAHHCPADTFTKIVDSSYAKYRIALSGTIVRKDQKHIMFPDYFGHKIFRPPQSHTLNPRVKIVKTGISLTHGETWVKKVNNLLYDEDYQRYVATIAATQINIGHSVLVIADRVEFLQNVKEWLGDTCLLVTGGTSFEEREKVKELVNSEKAMCIAGSRQIFSEGISIDRLSCVILASPISNEALLEQIIGRIMRQFPNKPDPIVIDLNFAGFADKKQNNLRLGFYLNKGWEIESM
jgi:superfamily II DNA or RNA helicase